MGRSQQPVDHFWVGVEITVGEEGLCFLGRWRQARQIEVGAADERQLAGFGRERESLGLELGENEGIDRVAYTIAILHVWRVGPRGRPERPKLAVFVGNQRVRTDTLRVRG